MAAKVIPLVFALLCAGCSGSGQAPVSTQASTTSKPIQLPENVPYQARDLRFHWSAAPGIDLVTGPAVAVRAYIESYRLVEYAGGDLYAAYPGFTDATPENIALNAPEIVFQLQHVRPETRAELEKKGWTDRGRRYSGYQPIHIQDLSARGTGYRATVCIGRYSVYESVADNPSRFYSIDTDPKTGRYRADYMSEVEIWRVDLARKDFSPNSFPNTPQFGPLPVPSNHVANVFSPWSIEGASDGNWGTRSQREYVGSMGLRKQCEDAMPDDAATRRAMSTGFHDQPPPHGDPIPGWPEK